MKHQSYCECGRPKSAMAIKCHFCTTTPSPRNFAIWRAFMRSGRSHGALAHIAITHDLTRERIRVIVKQVDAYMRTREEVKTMAPRKQFNAVLPGGKTTPAQRAAFDKLVAKMGWSAAFALRKAVDLLLSAYAHENKDGQSDAVLTESNQ